MTEINTTKGGTEANSYAAADEADDFLETQYGAEGWAELTDDQKEALLVTATRQINALRIIYPSATTDQRLKFPVSTGTDADDGFTKAQEATILQAAYLLRFGDELQESEGNRIQGITDQRIGPNLSRSSSGFNPMARISPDALNILASYIDLTLRAAR